MKIAFLSRYQHTTERGAENFVKELALRLSKNHLVAILAGNDADSLSRILKGKFDIVIPINGRLQSLKASLFRLIGGYKLLITGHSGRGWDDIWNIVIAKPDVFIALTDVTAKWAESWAWGSKVLKIPNGVDLIKFSPRGDKFMFDLPRPIFLSVGALVWYKHHDRLIKAVSGLSQGSVLIVGEGPDKERLQKVGRNLLDKRFKIINVKYDDMPKVYRAVDLFSLPSWDRESFGIVYLEALASGLRIVAPNDETRREVIGKAGIFIDTSNIKNYSQALQDCLSKKWDNIIRQQSENFSWNKIAKQYESVMLEMLKIKK